MPPERTIAVAAAAMANSAHVVVDVFLRRDPGWVSVRIVLTLHTDRPG